MAVSAAPAALVPLARAVGQMLPLPQEVLVQTAVRQESPLVLGSPERRAPVQPTEWANPMPAFLQTVVRKVVHCVLVLTSLDALLLASPDVLLVVLLVVGEDA